MNYSSLKSDIAAVVKTNGAQEITGANLQQVLVQMINNSVGAGYLYAGVATESTTPGTPDQNVFYLAGAGTYGNFGGTIVPQGSLGVFKYNGTWTVDVIKIASSGVPDELGEKNVVRQSYVSWDYVFDADKTYDVKITFNGYSIFNLYISKEQGYVPSSSSTIDLSKLQIIGKPIETNNVFQFSITPTQTLYNILVYAGIATLATTHSIEITEEGIDHVVAEIQEDIKKIDADLDINDLNRVVTGLDVQWLSGGYYLRDSSTLISGSGWYATAIDISDYVGDSVLVCTDEITNGSARAVVVTDANNNVLASVRERDYKPLGFGYSAALLLPTGAKYVYLSISTRPTQKDVFIAQMNENAQVNTEYWVDSTNGDDNNDGSKDSPFATFAKLRNVTSGMKDVVIHVASGVYDETLNLGLLKGNVKIYGDRTGDGTIITGAEYITGWSAVSGHAGVYQCAFSDTIPVHGGYNQGRGVIYEDVPSLSITERHPAQKGLSHRLPFTMIQQSTASSLSDGLAELDTSAGWYLDSGVLYMRNSDGTNPQARNYTYQKRRALQIGELDSLYISDVSFRVTNSIVFTSKVTERYNCSILGCASDGFVDNADCLRSYFDECAACGNDGANGHYNAVTGWQGNALRISGESCEYYYAWCHDNYDDGLSHHGASHVRIVGGLFEYNGDGGIRISNTGNCEVISALFRYNGQDNTSGASSGSGFDLVNNALTGDTRTGCSAILYDCVSIGNRYGFAVWNSIGRLTLVNCLSKDSTTQELHAKDGQIIAERCSYIQADANKIKGTEGQGVITINQYNDFE